MNNVIVTYQGTKLRGKIVGATSTHYAVDICAADLTMLRTKGYYHPCVIVPRGQVSVR